MDPTHFESDCRRKNVKDATGQIWNEWKWLFHVFVNGKCINCGKDYESASTNRNEVRDPNGASVDASQREV